ncbi:MAG: TIGR03960 family B12-binding radical SAM protein [Planctomycetes bacterium]|nr:TIGR03960 family B12-binding radical SAM protein [Planctomycetota bacterium]MCW8134160.1 TIGR03960 family B12-binding radical SAM protein [Planctomycetota bacterium]
MNVLERVLPYLPGVKTPAQYMGGEVNAIAKPWEDRVRFALCFPDTYAIGMSNQGFRILYHLLNERFDDIVCERAFAPWHDMERVLRDHSIPLYSLENYRPLGDFDVLGFSLQNETSYTNLLNMLDLARVTLRRGGDDNGPIIIAGGTGALTPEPLADFVDAFLPGEGEDVLPAFLHLVGVWRGRLDASILERYRLPTDFSVKDVYTEKPFTLRFAALPQDLSAIRDLSRRDFLLMCAAALPGCYVPAAYDVEYGHDGTIAALKPNAPGVPARVKKNAVANLNTAFYPTRQILPYVQVIQDRVTIEIMRGCTEGCRYCQAGMIDRPQRYRTPETVVALAEALVRNTGYDEISLLSLSSSDHPQLVPIIRQLQEKFAGRQISVALPSLRVDQQLTYLPGLTKNVRKSGLTLAPETGSERLRRVINKTITQHDLVEGARAALNEGYKTIKFYMMIGLPTETEGDIRESADLLNQIASMARQMKRHNFTLNVTVSLFVPKSFTPFQWEGMASRETLERHTKLLRSLVRHKNIRLKVHPYETSWLEALYSRGDRRLGRLTEIAWQMGARFDAWEECCDLALWRKACEQAGIDADWYIHRQRGEHEYLPWDMISVGTNKQHLWSERVRSRLEEYTNDCSGHTPGCIACGVEPLTCRTGLDAPADEMNAQMQRRTSVRYAPEFKARQAQKGVLASAAAEFFKQ